MCSRRFYVTSYEVTNPRQVLGSFECLYLLGLFFVYLFEVLLFPNLPMLANLPFLPLMIYSLYCALGLVWCWLRLYNRMLSAVS